MTPIANARFSVAGSLASLLLLGCGVSGEVSDVAAVSDVDRKLVAVEDQLASDSLAASELCLNYIAICEQGLALCLQGTNAQVFATFCSQLTGRCRATVNTWCSGRVDAGPGQPIDAGTRADAGQARDAGSAPDAGAPGDWTIQGFAAAAGVTGGAGGQHIVVTNLNSSGPGSLREAVENTSGPRVVTFTPGLTGTITHATHVYVESNDLTLDGAGANITLTGASINPWKSATSSGSSNIIIRNLHFVNTMAEKSSIYIVHGARNIWIDHNTFSNNSTGSIGEPIAVWNYTGEDGLTGITISWNRFNAPNTKAVLIGSQEQTVKKSTRVSLHHNWFNGSSARNPRVHDGTLAHMWNNYVTWGEVGMNASALADVQSENDIFEHSGGNATVVDYGGPMASSVNVTGSLLVGSPLPTVNTVGSFPRSLIPYSVSPEPATAALKQRIKAGAGANP